MSSIHMVRDTQHKTNKGAKHHTHTHTHTRVCITDVRSVNSNREGVHVHVCACVRASVCVCVCGVCVCVWRESTEDRMMKIDLLSNEKPLLPSSEREGTRQRNEGANE